MQVWCKPYDIRVDDILPDGTPHVNIRFWCHDRNSHPVLVRVEDFEGFIRIQLPQVVNNKKFGWNLEKAHDVEEWLKRALKDHAPTKCILKKYFPLYYYQDKIPFMVLFFESAEAQRHCTNFLKKEKVVPALSEHPMQFIVRENEVSSLRKLLTLKKQAYTQWMTFNAEPIPWDSKKRISKPGNASRPLQEYIIPWMEMTPVPTQESKSWQINPRSLAYDIEVYSDNHKTFPVPYNIKHCIYNISGIGMDGTDQNSKVRYSLLYGECPPPQNAIHIETKSEMELLDSFEQVIEDYDPDILSGYNIFGFDNNYLSVRRKIYGTDFSNFSRLIHGGVTVIDKKWRSSGYGHTQNTIIDVEGRISVDMLAIIKRDYKLRMYNLNFVSKYFLRKEKHDVTAKDLFIAFERNQKAIIHLRKNPNHEYHLREQANMTRILEYCLQDSELTLELFIKLNVWISLTEMSSVVGVTIMELFTRGQQVRTFSLLFDLAYHSGYVITKREFPIMPYVGAFVFTPISGVHDFVIVLDFASLYPSIIIGNNLCYTTLLRKGMTHASIDPDKILVIEFNQEVTDDAKTTTEEEDNDFGQVENLKYESDSEDEEDAEEDMKQIKHIYDEDEVLDPTKKYIHHKYMWVKPEVRKGLMPLMLENLVGERKAVREELKLVEKAIKTCEDQSVIDNLNMQKIVLDKRQLALKVTANSSYGFMGAQAIGILPLYEAASCVTQIGQTYIKRCQKYLIEKYNAIIIYGDTDSVMIVIPGVNGENICQMGEQIAEELTLLFPRPLKLEFEKGMRMISFTKKRYAAYLIKKNGKYVTEREMGISDSDLPYILVRGIVTARRDNCSWLTDNYTLLLRNILNRGSIQSSYEIIVKCVLDLLEGRVNPVEELSVVKTLNAQYKSASCQMKLFSEKLLKIGKPAKPGERLSYLVLQDEEEKNGTKKLLGDKMILSEDFNPQEHEIDLVYYLDRLLKKPIDQLFYTGYLKQFKSETTFGYEPKNSRKHAKTIETPIEMISLILQDQVKGGASKRKMIRQISKLPQSFAKFCESVA